jgi:hypothetical protein
MAQAPNQGQSGNPTPPVNKKRFKIGCNIETTVLVAIIGLIDALAAVIIPGIGPNVCWGGIYGSLCKPTLTPPSSTPSTSSPTASTQTPVPYIRAYTFENDNDVQGWEFANSQPAEKQSLLQQTKSQGYNSQGSLELNTIIWGSGNATIPEASNDAYTFTAMRVFFNHENYLGKKVSCHLYLPDPPPGVYIRLFTISDKQDTDSYEYGKDKLYSETLAKNSWVELSMVIGDPENQKDAQFDPTHVNYIGLIIKENRGPNMGRTPVKILLDDCTIT